MHRVKRRVLATSVALLAGAILSAVVTRHSLVAALFGGSVALAVTVAVVLIVASVLGWLTSFDRGRSDAALRLDWYVPALKRLAPSAHASHSLPGRLLRRVLPASLQSNRQTKQRGSIRRGLRWIGLSCLASPVRRFVQAVSLVTFAILFFYVCWPYGARPQATGVVSAGWVFHSIDQDSGEFLFRGSANEETIRLAGGEGFLFDESAANLESGGLGAFVVAAIDTSDLRLRSAGELTPAVLDTFFNSSGPFAIHQTNPTAWPDHYTRELARKERIPAETFLIIDPLVSLSTAVASRSWVWSLVSAAAILAVCVLIPRGFCGYLCPLGTTIDLFDWAVAGRVRRFRVPDGGWWVHIKYYLLAGTLVCAVFGVLVSGFVAAIPVITRAMLFLVEPLQTGTLRGWHLIPSLNAGHFVSIGLFLLVLSLGFLRPRFWCKYVCPSGAVFSLGNLFRVTERKVESSCIHCNKCVQVCPFDAIKPDFTTRTTDCTLCQTCGGVCPTHAIKFVERWNVVELKLPDDPPTGETSLGRRGFLSLAGGSAAAVIGGAGMAGVTKAFGAKLDSPDAFRPVRPPGSVPEASFLEMCIRCGECFKACPNNVLQAEGFEQGLEGLWTPMVNADWAGCESSCNACGQVCPTGAIRALPLEEKRVARMGLAILNPDTCLPLAGREECDLCVQECKAAGYHAIEYTQVGTKTDESGAPIEGTGMLAPVVLQDLCVGCGLCQTRCYAINVKEKGLLDQSAIIIEAGEGKEDRLMTGSYIELRKASTNRAAATGGPSPTEYFVPEPVPDDPFGLAPAETTPPPTEDSGSDSDSPF